MTIKDVQTLEDLKQYTKENVSLTLAQMGLMNNILNLAFLLGNRRAVEELMKK